MKYKYPCHNGHTAFYLTEKPKFGAAAESRIVRDKHGNRIEYGSCIKCLECGVYVSLYTAKIEENRYNH
jgi:hypothetical protein